jgi:hypothetical protein
VDGATQYILVESDDPGFPSPTTVYSGTSTSTLVTVGDVGTYYYRVQAANESGSGPWSNAVSTVVTQTAVVPLAGRWSGYRVQFDVTSDSSAVSDFRLEVYVSGCGTYYLHWYDIPIAGGHFSKGGISGDFSTPTDASGSYVYAFEACNGWALGSGGWSATWKHSQRADWLVSGPIPPEDHRRPGRFLDEARMHEPTDSSLWLVTVAEIGVY